eukprot:30782-Pelagococcus_subviridis.AAC.7
MPRVQVVLLRSLHQPRSLRVHRRPVVCSHVRRPLHRRALPRHDAALRHLQPAVRVLLAVLARAPLREDVVAAAARLGGGHQAGPQAALGVRARVELHLAVHEDVVRERADHLRVAAERRPRVEVVPRPWPLVVPPGLALVHDEILSHLRVVPCER